VYWHKPECGLHFEVNEVIVGVVGKHTHTHTHTSCQVLKSNEMGVPIALPHVNTVDSIEQHSSIIVHHISAIASCSAGASISPPFPQEEMVHHSTAS
jgi:hypothetical protein